MGCVAMENRDLEKMEGWSVQKCTMRVNLGLVCEE